MMNRQAFYQRIRPLTGALSQDQVARIEAVLDGVEARKMRPHYAAYCLGTAHHESDHWKTAEEYASGKAYEGRKDLGNTVKGDGVRFKGRGLVQITGRRNYTDWAKRLGVDLVTLPKLAAELQYAVPILLDGMILGTFTGKKLADYMPDYMQARRIVNGMDKATQIAGYARVFEVALLAAGYMIATPSAMAPSISGVKPLPRPQATVAPKTQTSPSSKPVGGVIVAGGAIAAAFAAVATYWDKITAWFGF
jgi:hypothetical protein